MDSYYSMFIDTLKMFLFLGVELSILYILISFGVSWLRQIVPEHKTQALLSGKYGKGYVIAALLGSITPFCSCSTIPVLRGLLKARVPFGPSVVFLLVSPLLNPVIVGLFIVAFGLKVALIYSVIALSVSMLAGVVLSKLHFERYVILNELNTSAGCCAGNAKPTVATQTSCCDAKTAPTNDQRESCCEDTVSNVSDILATSHAKASKFQIAKRESWHDFKSVLPYLLVGISIGSVIYGFIPSTFIATYASGNNPFAVPIAALIGLPLYLRAETIIPLSLTLVGKGMSLGAVMALIIGSSGASLTEVILLRSLFKTPMVIAFLVVILSMAIFAGYLFQYVF